MLNKIFLLLVLCPLAAFILLSGCLQQELKCNAPYIIVGKSCCLDGNNDGICDKDELIARIAAKQPSQNTSPESQPPPSPPADYNVPNPQQPEWCRIVMQSYYSSEYEQRFITIVNKTLADNWVETCNWIQFSKAAPNDKTEWFVAEGFGSVPGVQKFNIQTVDGVVVSRSLAKTTSNLALCKADADENATPVSTWLEVLGSQPCPEQ